jgi:hypothetical protein
VPETRAARSCQRIARSTGSIFRRLFSTASRPRATHSSIIEAKQLFAVRKGAWKAHFLTQNGYGQPKPEAHEPPLLFNLGAIPANPSTSVAQRPEIIAELRVAVEKTSRDGHAREVAS